MIRFQVWTWGVEKKMSGRIRSRNLCLGIGLQRLRNVWWKHLLLKESHCAKQSKGNQFHCCRKTTSFKSIQTISFKFAESQAQESIKQSFQIPSSLLHVDAQGVVYPVASLSSYRAISPVIVDVGHLAAALAALEAGEASTAVDHHHHQHSIFQH